MRKDAEVQNAVRNLFLGAAPERQSELSELWKRYTPQFNFLTNSDSDSLYLMDAGAYCIVRFNNRATRAFWLASFIAWEGYQTIAKFFETNNLDLTRFREMIACFFRILTEDNLDAIHLPKGIPDYGKFLDKKKSPQMRAAAELATIATGWALLHEVRHLQHQQDGTSATQTDPREKRWAEELSCDLYATQFLLDKADKYAAAASEPVDKVRQKRKTGIYFALFTMVLINADRWHETDTHPAMEQRIAEVMRKMNAEGTTWLADIVAHMAFVALWTEFPDAPGPFK